MRIKFTIILILLNLIAATLLWQLNREDLRQRDSIREGRGLLGPEVMEIDYLSIAGTSLPERRVLERRQDRWFLTEPIDWQANSFAVQRILSQLQFMDKDISFETSELGRSGQSLADYGLDEPSLTLTYRLKGEEGAFRIGDATRVGNRLYVLAPDGKHVIVVNRSLIDSLILDLQDLRSQQVFDIPVFEIRAIAIQTTEPVNQRVRLNRDGEVWRFEAPLETAANSNLVDTTIAQLTALKVHRFVTGEEASAATTGLGNPSLRVTLQGSSRRQTLSVGNAVVGDDNPSDRFYAKMGDNPTVFTVSGRQLGLLRNAHVELRERRFMNFDPRKVTAVEIEKGNQHVSLQKLETGVWQVLETDGNGRLQARAADTHAVERLLETLRGVEALRFVTDAPGADPERYGFNAPERVIRLRGGKDQSLQTLVVGELLEGLPARFYARTEATPSVYEISAHILQQAKLQPLAYRDRVLEELPSSARIKRLRLIDLRDDTVLLEVAIDPQAQTWKDVLSGEESERRESIEQLLSQVRKFEVGQYLQEGYASPYMLDSDTAIAWRYRLEASVLLPGGDTPQVDKLSFTFSERLGGRLQIGGSEARQMIFSLPQRLIDALFNLTVEVTPPAPDLPPAEDAKVE